MSNVKENIEILKQSIPEYVTIVAVSKTQPIDKLLDAINAGQKDFGENKVQEMMQKYEILRNYDINWHMIGHLQTNKVKYIVPFVKLIHSVDSLKLLNEINKQSQKINKITNCLLQFHIATEETKFGLDFEEAVNLLESKEFSDFKNVRICGVMGMATFTYDVNLVRKEFQNLKNIFDNLKNNFFQSMEYFSEISMGMSGDWKIAIEEGSTILRIGTAIFGERNHKQT